MYWLVAIKLARSCTVSYEEWCNLYYDHHGPNEYQLRLCEETAHAVLVRNNAIKADVIFKERPRVGVPTLL